MRLARATVAKTKNALIAAGMLRRVMVPNFKKLGCELEILHHLRYAPGAAGKIRECIESQTCAHSILQVTGNTEGVLLSVYKDYADHTEFPDAVKYLRDNGILISEPLLLKMPLLKTAGTNLDLSALTKAALEIEQDI